MRCFPVTLPLEYFRTSIISDQGFARTKGLKFVALTGVLLWTHSHPTRSISEAYKINKIRFRVCKMPAEDVRSGNREHPPLSNVNRNEHSPYTYILYQSISTYVSNVWTLVTE